MLNVFLYTSLQNRFLFIIIVELNQNPWPPPFSNYDSSFIITIFFKLEFFRATSEVFSWSSMLKALPLGGWRLVLIDFLYNVSAWEKGGLSSAPASSFSSPPHEQLIPFCFSSIQVPLGVVIEESCTAHAVYDLTFVLKFWLIFKSHSWNYFYHLSSWLMLSSCLYLLP